MAVAIAEALTAPARQAYEPRRKPETGAIHRILAVLITELRPFEGRLGMALRMALSVVVIVAFMMSQQVPESVLACYLVFFAARRDAGAGMLIALALIVAVTIGIALGLVVMQLSADDSMVRVLIMVGFAFGGMYLSQATRLGSLGATAGFVFVFALSLIDFLPYPVLISHALSWIWVVVALPMAVLFVVNMLFGPNPAVLARRFVADRLDAAAATLSGVEGSDVVARKLLAEKSHRVGDLTRGARVFGFLSGEEARRLCGLAVVSSEVLALAQGAENDPVLASDISGLARSIAEKRHDLPHRHARSSTTQTAPLATMTDRVAAIWRGTADHDCPAPAREGLFYADAATNPAYWQFALKTVIAVFITYTIYTAWDWFEIHTAMITCFYVALASTGETLHKAALRIAGALIGGAMGIGSIVFLMPHMTDIGHLMVLVGVGSFLAGWVASGSELIRYAGWQMALAFFLCILPNITTSFLPSGFGPVFDTSVATDRVLGILIGNVVVALVFLSFWPASISGPLAKALGEATGLVRARLGGAPARLAEIWRNIGEAKRLSGLSHFEIDRLRYNSPLMPHVPVIVAAVEDAGTHLARLELRRQGQRYLYGAPRCAKAALKAHERAMAAFLDLAGSAIVTPEPQAGPMLIAALAHSASTLDRLHRLAGRLDRRARWHDDFGRTVAEYAHLQSNLENVVRGLA